MIVDVTLVSTRGHFRVESQWKPDAAGCTDTFCAFDDEAASVAGYCVLDDGKAQAGTTNKTTASFVHAVKSFSQARDMFVRYSGSIINYVDQYAHLRKVGFRRCYGPDFNGAVATPIFDRVVDQVRKDLSQLPGVAMYRGQRIGDIEIEIYLGVRNQRSHEGGNVSQKVSWLYPFLR